MFIVDPDRSKAYQNIELRRKIMAMLAQKLTTLCPDCLTTIRFVATPELGQLVTCPECAEEFEVVSLSPLKIEWTTGDPEDWDDDYDDDDYEFDDDDYDYDDDDYDEDDDED
jgi:lysine biosynthesis protein LysW